jgi:hypothetical protein
MNIGQVLRRGAFLIVLAAGLALLLTNLQAPGSGADGAGVVKTATDPTVEAGTDSGAAAADEPDRESAPANPSLFVQTDLDKKDKVPRPAARKAGAEPVGPFSISGLVVDESGRGVSGVQVTAYSKTLFAAGDVTAPGRSKSDRSAFTGIDGFYEFQGVADGEYRLRTEPDEQYEAAETIVRAGVDTADLVLRQRREDLAVVGTVRSDGEPLDGVQVAAVGQSSGAAYTDMNGAYAFDLQLTAGRTSYTLQFARDGYREKRSVLVEDDLLQPGAIRVDADLEPIEAFVEVTGSVLDKKGSPVPGETVQLYSEATRQRYTAVSGRRGEIRFPEVETSDDYMVSVRPADSFRDYVALDVEIGAAGADLDIVLEPRAYGRLVGQMVNPDGLPVPAFSLWLRSPEAVNQPARLVTSDQQGFFDVDKVGAGPLVFETRGSPHVSISGIELAPGETRDVMLVLDWGTHQVAGLVMDDMGRPISASELYVTSVRDDGGLRSHVVRRAVTDETGFFVIGQVGSGYHTIRVDSPGFQSEVIDHEVGRDSPEVIIRLERAYSHGM